MKVGTRVSWSFYNEETSSIETMKGTVVGFQAVSGYPIVSFDERNNSDASAIPPHELTPIS